MLIVLQWEVQQSEMLFELLDPEDGGNKVLRNNGNCKQSSRSHILEYLNPMTLILQFERQTNILRGCNKRLVYEGHHFLVFSP